jgi:coenzyme F420-0:L-glutamate ligase/coenzyme F420-1:gamma-L-glutamate ligase
MKLILSPLQKIPMVQPGDDLPGLILAAMAQEGITLQNDDILVIAQKIVSKAEGRLVRLRDVTPSKDAVKLAAETEKDPRFVELVLRESSAVLRYRPGTLIVKHRLGFVCANAGIDHSNVMAEEGSEPDAMLLLPEDPDRSAEQIRLSLCQQTGLERLGVMIIDSHGRAWRRGTVGITIGLAGVPGLVDMRGKPDLFGYQLRVTEVAAADELAAAASLMMGQAAEGRPVVHVRGFPFPLREGHLNELIRPKELDLFL